MRYKIFLAVAVAVWSGSGQAQTTALTATCRDGSTWSGATRNGACRGHGGVQVMNTAGQQYNPQQPTPAQSTPIPGPSVAAPFGAQPAAPNASTAAVPQPRRPAMSAYVPPANPAAGGGPGLVWVNSSSKVYHCPTDPYYGKTKRGAYMTEAAAKAGGNRAEAGLACS